MRVCGVWKEAGWGGVDVEAMVGRLEEVDEKGGGGGGWEGMARISRRNLETARMEVDPGRGERARKRSFEETVESLNGEKSRPTCLPFSLRA